MTCRGNQCICSINTSNLLTTVVSIPSLVHWRRPLWQSRFLLSNANDRPRLCVWRRSGERFADSCVLYNNRCGGCSGMVCNGFRFHHRTRLRVFRRREVAVVYRDGVLQDHLSPKFRANPNCMIIRVPVHLESPQVAWHTTVSTYCRDIPFHLTWHALSTSRWHRTSVTEHKTATHSPTTGRNLGAYLEQSATKLNYCWRIVVVVFCVGF